MFIPFVTLVLKVFLPQKAQKFKLPISLLIL